MRLLIDGYNLMHVTDIVGTPSSSETALHASRRALLNFLASSIDAKRRAETTIVFDAAGAPPGLPDTLTHESITICFARNFTDADEMLEHLIEEHPSPKTLEVVSGDHRVQRAARRRGASYVDSEQWFADLRTARRNASAADNAIAKPDVISREHVQYWLDEFSKPSSKDKPRK
jgi:predicted RNA-binding protein with PIN domain